MDVVKSAIAIVVITMSGGTIVIFRKLTKNWQKENIETRWRLTHYCFICTLCTAQTNHKTGEEPRCFCSSGACVSLCMFTWVSLSVPNAQTLVKARAGYLGFAVLQCSSKSCLQAIHTKIITYLWTSPDKITYPKSNFYLIENAKNTIFHYRKN